MSAVVTEYPAFHKPPEQYSGERYDNFRFLKLPIQARTASLYELAPAVKMLEQNYNQDRLHQKFLNLAKKWKADVKFLSSPSRIFGNENYFQIIRLGSAIVPYILQDLQKQPFPWFHALRILVEDENDKNIGVQYAGDDRKMAECWIEWGKKQKLIA